MSGPAPDFSDKQAVLDGLAERTRLREGPQGVERVLRALFRSSQSPDAEPLTERTLARIARMPVPVVTSLHRELEDTGMVEPGEEIVLTPGARKAMSQQWGWAEESSGERADGQAVGRQERTGNSQVCEQCAGTGISPVGAGWEAVRSTLSKHTAAISGENMNAEDIIRLAALMQEQGALAGKDVLVTGDDVALAAGIALAGKALGTGGRLARRVVALQSRDRPLRALRDLAVAEGVIIGLVTHDLRRPLMPDLAGDFDTIAVSAAASLHDVVLLVSRAIQASRGEGSQIYLLAAHGSLEDRPDMQQALIDMGLAFERLVPAFGGPGQDLYVLAVTGDSAPIIEGDADEPQIGRLNGA